MKDNERIISELKGPGLGRTISRCHCGDIRIPSDETCRIEQRWGKWKGPAAYQLILAESFEAKGHRTLQSIIVKSVRPDSLVV